MTNPFVSRPADLCLHRSGWVQLAPRRWITKRPIWDAAHDCQARPGHGPGGAWLRANGMRLPEAAEYEELHQIALHIAPFTLPTLAMLERDKVPRPWADARGADTPQMVAYRSANMRSFAWCQQHDAEVSRLLAAAGYDGSQPVANDGKHLDAQGDIVGWWIHAAPRREKIQNESAAHRSQLSFSDYATNIHGAFDGEEPPEIPRPTRDTEPPPDTEPAPPIVPAVSSVVPPPDGAAGAILRLGSRGPDVERWQRIVSATADGIFGPGTEAKTKAWQAARGLVADGVVGPKSWAAAALPAPVVVAPVGLELAAERTPITAAALFSVLSRVVPELGRESLLLLTAQSSHETDAWRSCWNFSLGNEKANPGWAGAYCYRYCDERLSPSGLRVAMASKSPRRDGKGDSLRVGATGTDGLTRVEFWPPHPQCRFRAFASLDEAAAAWLRLLRLPRYARAWASLVAADLDAFARDLHAGGYYTATVGLYTFAMRARLAQVRASV